MVSLKPICIQTPVDTETKIGVCEDKIGYNLTYIWDIYNIFLSDRSFKG